MKRLYQTDYFAHLFHQELPPLLELWQIRVHAHLCRSVRTAHAWKHNLVGIAIGGPDTGGDGVDSRVGTPGMGETIKKRKNATSHMNAFKYHHLASTAS